MRLSVKIFLGICIPSIISIIIISAILIDKNHNANIENETNKSIQEIKKVEENIKSVQGLNVNFDKVIKIISDYYEQKGISIIYYEDSNFKYSSNSEIAINSTELIKVSDNNYLSTIDKINNNYYLEISTRIDKNKVVVYVKNINSIYNSRAESIKLFIYITIVLIMAIAIIIAMLIIMAMAIIMLIAIIMAMPTIMAMAIVIAIVIMIITMKIITKIKRRDVKIWKKCFLP